MHMKRYNDPKKYGMRDKVFFKFWPALDAISLAPTPEARAPAATNPRPALKLLEEAFTARSDGGAFFSGRGAASPGLLDVALGCFLPALWACERLNGLSLLDASTTPLLCGWSERDGGAFFSGRGAASPGLLDVALGCFLPALWACERLNGLSLLDASTTPLLCGWSERFAATAAARAVMPETEEVVAFTRFLQTKFGVAAISK
uniref:GST C-terminal domain-containing protein n=1 Tax=Oryza brachyantha TaxID=4533 RepID=J3N2E3_ORYBR